MNEETLNFICAITGHDEMTIKQMYNDYTSSPLYSKIETEQQLESGYRIIEIKYLNTKIKSLEKRISRLESKKGETNG